MSKYKHKVNIKQIVILFLFAILGICFILYSWRQIVIEKSNNIVLLCESIEAALPKDVINKLEAAPNDIEKNEYRLIKKTLTDIVLINKNARFAYLYTQKNEKIYIIADSESEESKDYSPPGQEYTEASIDYKRPYTDGIVIVTKATEDRWGTWRSVLIPIKDKNTGMTTAVFAMDFNAKDWNKNVFIEILKSGTLAILALILIFIAVRIKERNTLLRNEISQRKQVEEALKESSIFLKTLMNAIPAPVFYKDLEGRYLGFNKSFEEMFGDSSKAFIGKNVFDIAPQELAEVYHAKDMELIRNPGIQIYESQLQDSKGIMHNVVYHKATYTDSNGIVRGLIGIMLNITERKRIEETLRLNEEKYRQLFDQMMDGFALHEIICNSEGKPSDYRFLEVNKAFEQITGLQASNIINKTVLEILPNTEPIWIDLYGKVAIEGTSNHLQQFSSELNKTFEVSVFSPAKGKFATIINDITERIKVEELIKESEERFRSVAQSANDAIITASSNGIIIEWNPSAERIFGFKESEIVGQSVTTIIPENNREQHTEGVKRLEHGGEKHVIGRTVELEGLRKDGITLPIELSISEWETSKGTFFTGIIRDISKRKQTEEEIRMLANAMRSVNECVSITDMKDKVLFVNESFLKTYGYNERELLGANISIVHSPKIPLGVAEQIIPSTLSGRWEGELLNTKKDGTEFPVYLSTSVVHDNNGKPIALIGVSQDITERKKADELLKNSEERYRALVENVGEGIAFVNPDEIFEFANPITEIIFGVKRGELVGRNLKDFLDREQFEAIRTQTHAREEGNRNSYEIEFIRNDGQKRNLLITAVPQFDGNGAFLGAYGVFRDITNQKQAEQIIQQRNQELQALNVSKDRFFSIIAHDLKSPFNTLLGLSELLVENVHSYDLSTTQSIIENLHSSTLQTYRLLENLLDWARNQQNRIEFNPKKNNIREIIDEIINLLKPAAEAKNITLKVDIKPSCFALADTYMLNAILRNLISNAIKFTRKGGEIRISTHKQKSMILFSISDNGVGIKPDYVSRLFRIDSNVSQAGTSGEKGTGLGLLLCKEFIEKNGGEIWIDSEFGKGSTFYFTLKQFDKNVP